MSIADVFLIILMAIAIFLAPRYLRKNRGGCTRCRQAGHCPSICTRETLKNKNR